MRVLLLALAVVTAATTACVTTVGAAAPVEAPAGVDAQWDSLSPYGRWWWAGGYGWVFTPFDAQVADWRPYEEGHWAMSPNGWLWVSDEPFGWATYHYGRWVVADGRWAWIPGDVWAPAWVTWRTGPGFIGWAPVGLEGTPATFVVVDRRDFLAPRVAHVAAAPSRSFAYVGGPRVVHNAPDRRVVERDGGRRAPYVTARPRPVTVRHRR